MNLLIKEHAICLFRRIPCLIFKRPRIDMPTINNFVRNTKIDRKFHNVLHICLKLKSANDYQPMWSYLLYSLSCNLRSPSPISVIVYIVVIPSGVFSLVFSNLISKVDSNYVRIISISHCHFLPDLKEFLFIVLRIIPKTIAVILIAAPT